MALASSAYGERCGGAGEFPRIQRSEAHGFPLRERLPPPDAAEALRRTDRSCRTVRNGDPRRLSSPRAAPAPPSSPSLPVASTLGAAACTTQSVPPPAAENGITAAPAAYFDTTGRKDVVSGGARLIPISTPKGTFNVWTKRVGNDPTIKVLLLHGGPGMTHEYFEAADAYFPGAGVEYYYYDQLGSFSNSDQPKDSSLWNTERFVEEVEQVRKALGLDQDKLLPAGAVVGRGSWPWSTRSSTSSTSRGSSSRT